MGMNNSAQLIAPVRSAGFSTVTMLLDTVWAVLRGLLITAGGVGLLAGSAVAIAMIIAFAFGYDPTTTTYSLLG